MKLFHLWTFRYYWNGIFSFLSRENDVIKAFFCYVFAFLRILWCFKNAKNIHFFVQKLKRLKKNGLEIGRAHV